MLVAVDESRNENERSHAKLVSRWRQVILFIMARWFSLPSIISDDSFAAVALHGNANTLNENANFFEVDFDVRFLSNR